jgi:hypothetical protein
MSWPTQPSYTLGTSDVHVREGVVRLLKFVRWNNSYDTDEEHTELYSAKFVEKRDMDYPFSEIKVLVTWNKAAPDKPVRYRLATFGES